MLERVKNRLRRDREDAAQLRKAARQTRIQQERIRRNSLARLVRARSLLQDVVREIDRALGQRGLILSAADDICTWPMIGAVEIRLKRIANGESLGLLDICADQDGTQDIKPYDTKMQIKSRLPPLARATSEHYRIALLTFVERAIVEGGTRQNCPCAECGRVLAA